MSYLRIDITYDENVLTPAMHGRLMNRLYRGELEHHKKVILPRHFQNVPETTPHGAYGYAPRSKRWQERKRREGRPDLPNVYTGQLRDMAVSQSVVRATQKGGTLTVKSHFPLTEQRRAELEAFSTRETAQISARIERLYAELSQSPDYARKRAPKRLRSRTG